MSDKTEPVVTNEQAIAFIEAIGCHGDDWISEADLIAKELTAIVTAAVAKREAEIVQVITSYADGLHKTNSYGALMDVVKLIQNGGGA